MLAHPAGDSDEEELELSRHKVENLSKVPTAQSSILSRLSFLVVQATHVFPGVPYPEYTAILPIPYRVGTNTWNYMDASGAAVTTSGDLYLWPARSGNGQTFVTPAWLPSPIRSNVVCRLSPPIP